LKAIAGIFAACLAMSTGVSPADSADPPVIVDLSKDFVAITAGFTGTEVLLFGSTKGKGKVVIVIEGPANNATIRMKERVAGIWVNGSEVTFEHVPAFYQVLSTDELGDWLPAALREEHHIGLDNLSIRPLGDVSAAEATVFRNALIRNKQQAGHYGKGTGQMKLAGGRLFRSTVFFPADVQVGVYSIRTYLIENRKVVSSQVLPLAINKTGLEAELYRAAHQHSALYGIAAIVIAVLAGLGGNMLFRRN
jgi:uncharacterized protein (TIGR02186 family)